MEILQITIEVSENEVDTIIVKKGDRPEHLAAQFCLKHGLSDEIFHLLTEQFTNKIMAIATINQGD
jgi:hypothetical protein